MVKRRGTSTFIGIEAAINLEPYTSKNDDETVCHFPARTTASAPFIDAVAPRRLDQPLHLFGLLVREGHRREREQAMIALVADRKKIAKQFPNLVDYESKQAFLPLSTTPRRSPPRATPVKDIVLKKGFFGTKRVETTRALPPRRPRRPMRARFSPPRAHRHPARAQHLLHGAVLPRTTSRRSRCPKQNVIVFSDATTVELWVEGGKYGSIDPCFPSKVAQAHIHNLFFHHHADDKKLDYIFFPILTHVPSFGEGVMDKTRAARSWAGVPDA